MATATTRGSRGLPVLTGPSAAPPGSQPRSPASSSSTNGAADRGAPPGRAAAVQHPDGTPSNQEGP